MGALACLIVIASIGSYAWAFVSLPPRNWPSRIPLSLSAAKSHEVTILYGGDSHKVKVLEDQSILEAGLDAGLELPHDCRLGVCLTCPGKVVSGTVDQSGTTLDDSVVEQGYALMCMTYPRSDMVIQCIDEDELVSAQFSGRS